MVTPLKMTRPAAANCAASFGIGPSEKRSSSRPASEEDRDPADDRDELSARRRRTYGNGGPEADQDAGEDADSAEHRSGALMPAILAWGRPQPGRERGSKQEPDGRGGGGTCCDRREHLHGGKA